MISSSFQDSDGFKLKFEENCSDSDKKFFMEQYPKVDEVANMRLHCTTCNVHIGTAPVSEKMLSTHLVLKVTQCCNCYTFYNIGDFGRDEDGYEQYCKWCGGISGGKVFCCSSCPFVFCKKCISSNISSSYVHEVQKIDYWLCFACDKEVLKPHRAQHWALKNFIHKQSEIIQKSDILNDLMEYDASKCCEIKKPKVTRIPVSTAKSKAKDDRAQYQFKVPRVSFSKMDFPKPKIPPKNKPKQSPLVFRITKGKFIKIGKQSPRESSTRRKITPVAQRCVIKRESAISPTPIVAPSSNSKLPVLRITPIEKSKNLVDESMGIFMQTITRVMRTLKESHPSADMNELYTYIETLFGEKFRTAKEILNTETKIIVIRRDYSSEVTADDKSCTSKKMSADEESSLNTIPLSAEVTDRDDPKMTCNISNKENQSPAKDTKGSDRAFAKGLPIELQKQIIGRIPVAHFKTPENRRKSLLEAVLTANIHQTSTPLTTTPTKTYGFNALLESIRRGVPLKPRDTDIATLKATKSDVLKNTAEILKQALAHRQSVFRGDSMSPAGHTQHLNESEWSD